MATPSIDSFKSGFPAHVYVNKKFAPEGGEALLDRVEGHPATQPGHKLATEGYTSGGTQPTPATLALVRHAEVLKKQIGAGRHALRGIAGGSAAIGLAVACAGHPWAGFAVAAVGLMVGFGVQAYVRHRALKQAAPNGLTGAQFKEAFEALYAENNGIVRDPMLETSRKMYDFLSRNMYSDAKHDLFEPTKRGAVGVLRAGRRVLAKVFVAKAPPTVDMKSPEELEGKATV